MRVNWQLNGKIDIAQRFQVCHIKHKLLKKHNLAGISKENKDFIQQKYGVNAINRKEYATLSDDAVLHKPRRSQFQPWKSHLQYHFCYVLEFFSSFRTNKINFLARSK